MTLWMVRTSEENASFVKMITTSAVGRSKSCCRLRHLRNGRGQRSEAGLDVGQRQTGHEITGQVSGTGLVARSMATVGHESEDMTEFTC